MDLKFIKEVRLKNHLSLYLLCLFFLDTYDIRKVQKGGKDHLKSINLGAKIPLDVTSIH